MNDTPKIGLGSIVRSILGGPVMVLERYTTKWDFDGHQSVYPRVAVCGRWVGSKGESEPKWVSAEFPVPALRLATAEEVEAMPNA